MRQIKQWKWLDDMEFCEPSDTDCYQCLCGDHSRAHIRRHLRLRTVPGSLISNALNYFNRPVNKKAFEKPDSIRLVLRRYFTAVLNSEGEQECQKN